MKRRLVGLSEAGGQTAAATPDGIFLVCVDSAHYRWHAQKPFYELGLTILEPKAFAGSSIGSRLYCTPKAMWKLGWFLRDFIYDPELLSQSEVDERALRGLVGIVKVSHSVINGIRLVNLDGFAPASQWEELSNTTPIAASTNGRTSRKDGVDHGAGTGQAGPQTGAELRKCNLADSWSVLGMLCGLWPVFVEVSLPRIP